MRTTQTRIQTARRIGGVAEYYFSRKLREIAARRTMGEDILNLGIGNPDLPPPPQAASSLEADLQREGAHGYQSYRGTPALRGRLLRWYAEDFGVRLADDELLPLAGSKEGIAHLCLGLLDPGTATLVPDPGYPAYAAATRLAEADALPYPLPRAGERPYTWLQRLEAALPSAADVRIVFVNSPHMPTGQVLSGGHVEALAAFAKTRGAVLVADVAYAYYHPDGPTSLLRQVAVREVGVELNSLSKSHHMPGWRLGVLAGRADVVTAALTVKSNLDSGQFRPLQAGATAALDAERAWHARRDARIAERRCFATDLLGALGCRVPENQHGLFVWAQLPEGASGAEAFADRLLDEAGVFLPPGTVFGPGGEGHCRLSLCSPLDVLREARTRLAAAGLVR